MVIMILIMIITNNIVANVYWNGVSIHGRSHCGSESAVPLKIFVSSFFIFFVFFFPCGSESAVPLKIFD